MASIAPKSFCPNTQKRMEKLPPMGNIKTLSIPLIFKWCTAVLPRIGIEVVTQGRFILICKPNWRLTNSFDLPLEARARSAKNPHSPASLVTELDNREGERREKKAPSRIPATLSHFSTDKYINILRIRSVALASISVPRRTNSAVRSARAAVGCRTFSGQKQRP